MKIEEDLVGFCIFDFVLELEPGYPVPCNPIRLGAGILKYGQVYWVSCPVSDCGCVPRCAVINRTAISFIAWTALKIESTLKLLHQLITYS
jgi:hypothetical protein